MTALIIKVIYFYEFKPVTRWYQGRSRIHQVLVVKYENREKIKKYSVVKTKTANVVQARRDVGQLNRSLKKTKSTSLRSTMKSMASNRLTKLSFIDTSSPGIYQRFTTRVRIGNIFYRPGHV